MELTLNELKILRNALNKKLRDVRILSPECDDIKKSLYKVNTEIERIENDIKQNIIHMKNREPWNFCETPKEKCTMNYCDENGCQNRKRNYVEDNDLIDDVVGQSEQLICDT